MKLVINDRIRNRSIDFFDDVNIHLKYGSLGSEFSFKYLFNPDNIEHKELSCIGHYHIAYIEHLGQRLMTGFCISTGFDDSPVQQLTEISGYSLPGMLNDIQSWIGTEPAIDQDTRTILFDRTTGVLTPSWQSDGLSLKQIVDKIVKVLGIEYIIKPSVEEDMNIPFDETTIKEDQAVGEYIVKLALQRNIVPSHDDRGRIIFDRPASNQQPLFHFERGAQGNPATRYTCSFNGQGMHSHIRVVEQADEDPGIPGVEAEVRNPYVPFVFRPRIEKQNNGNANNVHKSASTIRAQELRNHSIGIELNRWDLNGKIITPGRIITVTNKYIYQYKKTKWFIEEVVLNGTAEKQTATLKCVPPEVYTGEEPVYPYAGINLH